MLGCSDSVQSVLKLGDTDGDSLIDESEFRLPPAMSNIFAQTEDKAHFRCLIHVRSQGVLMRNLAKRLDQMDLHPKRLGFHLPEANSLNSMHQL